MLQEICGVSRAGAALRILVVFLFQLLIYIAVDTIEMPHLTHLMSQYSTPGTFLPPDQFFRANEFSYLVMLALFLPSLGVQVRRLHDANHSGWWVLGLFGIPFGLSVLAGVASALLGRAAAFLLIALAGISVFGMVILLLVWLCTPGTNGNNRFGADPLRDF